MFFRCDLLTLPIECKCNSHFRFSAGNDTDGNFMTCKLPCFIFQCSCLEDELGGQLAEDSQTFVDISVVEHSKLLDDYHIFWLFCFL